MKNLAHSEFIIDGWQVYPDEGLLKRADVVQRLEPKVMEVLVYFASYPGKVISREELEREVWRGALVGYDAVTKTVIKLRKALQDDAKEPRCIATIPKKGYQLIAEVEITETERLADETLDQLETHPRDQQSEKQDSVKNRKLTGSIVAIAGGLITLAALWFFSQPQSLTSPTTTESGSGAAVEQAVVVLPFHNLSNDPEQEYFSDGITDDIITDLSRVDGLRVIARQSAYHFKGQALNLNEVARKLGVQYIVEGSVQKAGQQIRINVQLTNAAKGQNIWAERYEGKLDSIFSMQDKITRHVISAVFNTLAGKHSAPVISRSTSNFEAYDLFLLGQQYFKRRSQEGYELTTEAYKKAIELDPEYARAYGALAVTLTNRYRQGWTDLSLEEARERALQLVTKAVDLNNTNPQVYWSKGFVHLFRKEYAQAQAAAERAISLSPNYADGYGLLAFIANWRGRGDAAETYIKKAIALNPYHTYDYPWNLGLAYYNLGKYADAVPALKDALERNESAAYPRLFLTASYVRLGRMDDAQWEIEQLLMNRTEFSIEQLANTIPYEDTQRTENFLQDLRKAGLPES